MIIHLITAALSFQLDNTLRSEGIASYKCAKIIVRRRFECHGFLVFCVSSGNTEKPTEESLNICDKNERARSSGIKLSLAIKSSHKHHSTFLVNCHIF